MNNTPTIAAGPQPEPQATSTTWARWRRRLGRLIRIGLVLVTLAVLFYLVEYWRGARAWAACRKDLAAQGQALEVSAVAPPPVPDDQNFAATPFLAPLFDFLPGTQTWRDTNATQRTQQFAKDFLQPSGLRATPWLLGERTDFAEWLNVFNEAASRSGPNQAPRRNPSPPTETAAAARQVAAILEPYAPVLDALRLASQRPCARFNLRYEEENAASILLPHLAVLKVCVRMLSLRASAELALSQADQALEDVLLACQVTDSMRLEPLLISQLVRSAQLEVMLQPVWEGLRDRRWDGPQLERLQRRLGRFDFIADCRLALAGEQAFGNSIITYVRRNPRVLLNLLAQDLAGTSESLSIPWFLIPRGWFYLEQVSYNRLFQEHLRSGMDFATRRIDPRTLDQSATRLPMLFGSEPQKLFRHRLLSSALLPALPKAVLKLTRAQASADEAVIACALERARQADGDYPEALPALTPRYLERLPLDALTGGPLTYRHLGRDSFALYSMGWNLKDDGGVVGLVPKEQSQSKPDFAEGDWVWRAR